ncbi:MULTISPECIES: hypothetical protein [Rhodopseudomonas]|uniref:hypothetical protein n=1 Tax=Rhodopseudomonas TaxID=1073 RepID=UPI000A7B3662|nr:MULTISPECIES: hypothetical protein [Rhodopseudomonas]MDF3812730.1 hypothetical protein [Rhodopseudomonas sp. BAL398]WOK20870.1 hypothetical protein RBJ75_16600 [Rhodopseudomonas sp. BAL398]
MIDLFSRRVVGWSMSASMTAQSGKRNTLMGLNLLKGKASSRKWWPGPGCAAGGRLP